MAIPSKVRVSGHEFKVVQTEKATELGGEGHIGYWRESEGFIALKATMVETQKEETLLHEMIEIILNSIMEVDPHKISHSVIQSLSSILYQSLKDSGMLFFAPEQIDGEPIPIIPPYPQ